MTTVIPTTAGSRFMQIAARQGHRTNGCPKNASRCPKNASQTILHLQTLPLKQETNGRRMPTEARHPSAGEAAMKRCAQCHGKLGLGVRSRNFWNGRWWAQLASVRLIAKVNTSWSVTALTLNNIFGT